MKEWKNIGQVLIDNGVLTPKTVARVMAISRKRNKRFGWTLEKLGMVTGTDLATALAQQYRLKMAPRVASFKYPPELLQLIPVEAALQHLVFPLKQTEDSLYVAVVDPTETRFLDNLAVNRKLRIIPCVATRTEVYTAICRHYLQREYEESRANTSLLVEDELTSQMTAANYLTKAGYTVLTAGNGLEGFGSAIARKPQVILTDKVMPKLDGFALLKSLKTLPELESAPVIMMSDKLSPEEEMRIFEMGFFDYIAKPVNRISLVSRVKRAFRYSEQLYGLF